MAEYTANVANKGMRASVMTIIIGGLYASPLFYLYIALKVLILGVAWLLFAAWDLVTTIFGAFWSIMTSYRFLLAFAIVFIALIFIHLYVYLFLSLLAVTNAILGTGRALSTSSGTL